MAKAKKTAKPYLDHVIILGANVRSQLAIEASSKPGIYIIGNVQKHLSIKSLITEIEVLREQKKIGPNTQIHITCHSAIDTSSTSRFYLGLDERRPVLSADLFKTLNKLMPNTTLNISLYSCYSGLAKDEFTHLTRCSTLTTYTSPESISLLDLNDENISTLCKEEYVDDPFKRFIHSLCADGNTFSSFGINTNDHKETFTSRMQAQAFSEGEIMRWQRFEINRFIAHCDGIKSGFTAAQQEQFSDLKKALGKNIIDTPPKWLEELQRSNIEKYSKNLLFNFINLNKTDAAKGLLDAGVEPNAKTYNMYTPLHAATQKENTNSIEALLSAGADIEAPDQYKNTPLIMASCSENKNVINALIGAGADVNAQNKYGDTALMIATSSGNVGIFKDLIDAGADINAINQDGDTAFDLAKRKSISPDMLSILKPTGKTKKSFAKAEEERRKHKHNKGSGWDLP